MVKGGTRPNVIAEEAYAEVDLRIRTLADADEFVARIQNLRPRTEGVSIKVVGGLNRPPYEKGNAGAALYQHARSLAAEIGFELVDTSTGGGSDGNFTAPHTATLDGLGVDGKGAHTHYEQMYISSIEPRARLLHRLYQTLAMSIAGRDPDHRDASSDAAAAPAQGAFFGRRKGHKLRAHQAGLIEQLLPRLSLDIGNPGPSDLADLFDPPVREIRLEIGFGGGEHLIAEARAFPDCRVHRLRALCQRHGQDPDADRGPQLSAISGCWRAMPPNCWRGCRRARWRGST